MHIWGRTEALYILYNNYEDEIMARYQYTIISHKRLKVERNVGEYKTIRIKGVTEIREDEENVQLHYDIRKGKKDVVFNTLLWVALFDLICLMVLMLVADFASINIPIAVITTDCVASASLLATIYSFPRMRKFLGEKVFAFGEVGNKLCIRVLIIILSLMMGVLLHTIGITAKLANVISAVCVIVALQNMQ